MRLKPLTASAAIALIAIVQTTAHAAPSILPTADVASAPNDPTASAAGTKGDNTTATVYGLEDHDHPDQSRVIYGAHWGGVTKYVVGGAPAAQGVQGSANPFGGFLAWSILPLPHTPDANGGPAKDPAGQFLYDITHTIVRLGLVVDGTYGSAAKTTASTTPATQTGTSTTTTTTSTAWLPSLQVGAGIHFEFPDTDFPLFNLIGIKSPFGVGILAGKNYSFQKNDPTNAKTWVGVSMNTFF